MSKIHIVGAGVSGLVAAIELERAGFSPVIIEATDRIGGRVKTDSENGILFDHGFQVLLTAYPVAQRYLDYPALELQRFLPGAVIFKGGRKYTLGDPLRHTGFLGATAFFPLATLGDKWKIWQLSRSLKSRPLGAIFAEAETTTLAFLQNYGFSEKIIDSFFRPFYSGIFLEPELQTSSRMFQFVFKMFAEGHAAVPKSGMQAIPEQLKSKLENTEFQFGKRVSRVKKGVIILEDGTELASDCTLIAGDPGGMIEGYPVTALKWHHCRNLYFRTAQSSLQAPIIGLVADPDALINNLHYPTDLAPASDGALLSVTVVKVHQLDDKQLVEQVKKELRSYCGITEAEFIRQYTIQRALPILSDLKYGPTEKAQQYADGIFLAGDYLANGSLNAAMESGRQAAGLIIEKR